MEEYAIRLDKRAKRSAAMRRKRLIRDAAIGVGIAVVAGVALFIAWRYYVGENKIDIERDFSYYLGGQEYEYDAPAYIDLRNETRELVAGDVRVPVSGGRPVYFTNADVMTLVDMSAVDYASGQSFLLPIYSEVYYSESGVHAVWDGTKHSVSARLLHDGADTYVLMSNSVVSIDGEKYQLSPMSYVVAVYGRSVELTDAVTGECRVFRTADSVTATFSDGGSVDMSLDILTQPNGTQQILMPNPAVFPEIP